MSVCRGDQEGWLVSSSSLEAPESPEHLEEWVWAKGEDLEEGAERARG